MKFYKIFFLILSAILFIACDDEDSKSHENQIIGFAVNDIKATIDETNKTISLSLPDGTDLRNIKPSIRISRRASVTPGVETELDFTEPVKYIVTAENGSKQEYTVIVTIDKSSRKYIETFVIGNKRGEIDHKAHTVKIEVPVDTDWSKITPIVTVSDEATVSPASNTEVDFSNPVIYTVTAKDGSQQKYTVTVFDAISNAPLRRVSAMIQTVDKKESTRYYFEYNATGKMLSYATGHSAPRKIANFSYPTTTDSRVYQIILTEEPEKNVINTISTLNITYPDKQTVLLTNTSTNAVSKIELNEKGKVIKYTREDGKAELFEYDKDDNIIKYIDANGDYELMTFDNRNGPFKDSHNQQWLSLFTVSPVNANPKQIASVETYTKTGQLKETIKYKNKYNLSYNLYVYSYERDGKNITTSFFYK